MMLFGYYIIRNLISNLKIFCWSALLIANINLIIKFTMKKVSKLRWPVF